MCPIMFSDGKFFAPPHNLPSKAISILCRATAVCFVHPLKLQIDRSKSRSLTWGWESNNIFYCVELYFSNGNNEDETKKETESCCSSTSYFQRLITFFNGVFLVSQNFLLEQLQTKIQLVPKKSIQFTQEIMTLAKSEI